MGAMYDIGLIWSIWYRRLIKEQEQEARLAMGVTLGRVDRRHGEWGKCGVSTRVDRGKPEISIQ